LTIHRHLDQVSCSVIYSTYSVIALSSIHRDNLSIQAQQFAADGQLVIFVGAGVSSIPPACLPSWWAMNRSVVAALRDRVAELVGPACALVLAEAINTRKEANGFPPEYLAEVIVRRLGQRYNSVLHCLDTDASNNAHFGIAALAKPAAFPRY
jgi:hypothetical protein